MISEMEDKIDLNKALTGTEKDSLIGKMASAIAHEINNPIMVISNLISLIMDDIKIQGSISIDGESEYYQDLKEIIESCERITKITRNLSGIIKSSSKKPTVVELDELIVRTLKFLEPMVVKSQINLLFQMETTNLRCFIKSTDIQQAFMKLIQNSLYALNKKYSKREDTQPEEKIIKITIRKEIRDPPPSVQHLQENEKTQSEKMEFAVVDIFDDGVGMSEEIQMRIGEPFFTTKKAKDGLNFQDSQGLGLGIHSCISILEDNHGFLTFESEQDKFSCFHVFLPIYREEPSLEKVKEIIF